jgi:hypothetical protein
MVDQHGCGCCCNDGRSSLIPLPAVPGDDIFARCWCTQCGGSEGRCENRLNYHGLILATFMGNRRRHLLCDICFSCRTPEFAEIGHSGKRKRDEKEGGKEDKDGKLSKGSKSMKILSDH